MLSPILCVLVMAIGGTALYKGAEMEHLAGWPWTVASVAAWALAFLVLGWGLLLNLLIQVVLFVALGVVIYLRKKKPEVIK